MKTSIRILSLLAIALTSFACGAAPESTETLAEPLLIPLVMHVRSDTLQMVSPKGLLSESPANPTPLLTQVTVRVGTGTSVYSTSAHQAIVLVTATQFNAINAELAQEPGHTVDVDLTYDSSGTSTTKTVTAFSFPLI